MRQNAAKDNYLCAYVVPADGQQQEPALLAEQLKTSLSRDLPDYMVPTYIVPMDSFPLTPSGKIDMKALPEPDLTAGSTYEAPADDVEKTLAVIWSDVLGLPVESVGRNTHFFQSGGHSLNAALVTAGIYKSLEVKIPLADLFQAPVLKDLAAIVREAAYQAYAPIPKAQEKPNYPLSPPSAASTSCSR